MCRKTFTLLFLGAVSLLCSCVDNNYDIVNKDVSTDVKIEGNRISIPFGSLKAIPLDSLVDTDDIDKLEKSVDGTYCIVVDDSISPVEEVIDPVKLNVDRQEHSVEIDFSDVEIDSVHIEAKPIDPIVFSTPEISVEELNDKLPVLESDVITSISNENIDNFFEAIKADKSLNVKVALSETIGTGSQYVDCGFTYELPKEVESISEIWLKTRGQENSANGALVEVIVTNSALLDQIDKLVDFKITFPEYFVLHTDEYDLSEGKNEITVNDMVLKGESNRIVFYIKELKGLENKITEEGMLDIDDDIVYSLDYKLSGELNLTSNIKREDLDFNVSFNVPLAFDDLKGKTKDIKVDFESMVMDFAGHFDDLDYVDTIYYIDFDSKMSALQFESSMDADWLKEFKLKDGYALKIAFPKNLYLSDEYSTYTGKGGAVEYVKDDHALYVKDLAVLANSKWNLSLEKLVLDVPVYNKECDINVEAGVYFVNAAGEKVDTLIIAGTELESMSAALDMLKGDKVADFVMNSTDLVIDDAVVHASGISSEFDTTTDFNINEELPEEIGRLDVIELTKKGVLNFDISMSGLEDLDEVIHIDFYAVMPSFLKLENAPERKSGVDVTVKEDTLFITTDINPHKEAQMSFGIACAGFDFRTEEFGYQGFVPKDSTDGNVYLKYDGKITIYGEADIDDVDLHSDILERLDDIVFDIEFDVDEMQIKTFHGLYKGDIDEVEESFDLDLGDGLDFLKDDGNSITLAEPQIEILLENAIGVPIDVDMQIFGRDDNGEIIPTSLITERVSVKPAYYDEKMGTITPVETKLFLTCDSNKVSKIGYDNVQIPGLANLLEKVPNSIDFKIKPLVNTSQAHHIDIVDPLTFSGSYSVYIPLKFDNFNLLYNDTIDDLIDSFGENLDMLTNIHIDARMEVLNTIPLGLQLNVKALDMDEKPIETIEVEPVSIKAGLGGNIEGSDQEAQQVVIAINSSTGDFSTLDKLVISVEAASDCTAGSAAISALQGIKISDIVFDITGDIETDLSE